MNFYLALTLSFYILINIQVSLYYLYTKKGEIVTRGSLMMFLITLVLGLFAAIGYLIFLAFEFLEENKWWNKKIF